MELENYKFLGDIIICEHIEKNIQSSTIIIPETTRGWVKPVKARVLAIGKLIKSRKDYLRDRKKRGCSNKTFACDYISIGDIVLVPVELGTRGRVPGNDNAIIYDSEDILGIVEPQIPDAKDFINMTLPGSPVSMPVENREVTVEECNASCIPDASDY